MALLRAAALAVLFTMALIVPSLAQDVTLTSRDGKMSIDGTLLSYDGEFFRVDTVYGALTLDGTGVTCAGVGCPNLETFVAEVSIAGSRTMGAVLLPAVVEMFAEQSGFSVHRLVHDDFNYAYVLRQADTGQDVVRIMFQISNSDGGFAAMLAGDADMVLSSREITSDEAKAAYSGGFGDLKRAARNRIVALDGLVPVVSKDNPTSVISLEDLAKIFAGEITNWQDINGPDAPIYLHGLLPNSGLSQQFVHDVMTPENLVLSKATKRHTLAVDVVGAVAADPFAIGITRFSEVGNAKTLAIKGTCGMAFTATPRALKTKDYPLSLSLFLYTPMRRLPKMAREFLAFLDTPASQRAVQHVGFVDQSVSVIGIESLGRRFANAVEAAGEETNLAELQRMIKVLQPASRLTTTFRFNAGSSTLDAQSKSNILKLAHHLETGAYVGRELIFVGFSDGKGDASVNRKIAHRRAKAVRAGVRLAATTMKPAELPLSVEAFGEASPMACDDTEWGRQVNRRVEVWVK